LLSKNIKIKIYRTTIFPGVLYGCETWSLTLREERRLRVFENKMLRRIFGAKWDEVKEEQRRLHIMSSLTICAPHQILIWVIKSTTMRYAEHVARTGDRRGEI
jgi:hypothetical protein